MQNNINAIKVLSAEAVEAANSGHPGLPLGAATMAFTLWDRIMNHNPENPNWINRDRFILSAGHGSALVYTLLHLYGYGLTNNDLKNFRQVGSKTPGHPEYGHTIGVETTTGPLGQGIANGVGMAMAEKHLGAVFNKPGLNIIDHYTYVIAGDGCMMEGISYEAASLAGSLGLGKLIVLYDSNNITIEGSTELAFTEDVKKRYEAMHWDVRIIEDGNCIPDLEETMKSCKKSEAPSLIIVKTIIGEGAPGKEGTAGVHGSPLGPEVLSAMKKNLNWTAKPFEVPDDVEEYFKASVKRLVTNAMAWDDLYESYEKNYPNEIEELEHWLAGDFQLFDLEELKGKEKKIATRSASGEAINMLKELNDNLVGGSADLAPSNKTFMNDIDSFFKGNPKGRNIHFGVREHAMGGILNGLVLHGGLKAYAATFLVFSDYMKAPIRLSALMKIPSLFVFTHDSIGVGEDGPTHQPVEHLWMLRSIPGFTVYRPGDYFETMVAWYSAIKREEPCAIIGSRQNLEIIENSSKEALKGGYVVYGKTHQDGIIIATGSEVNLAIQAAKALEEKGKMIKVVSMLSVEIFEEQDESYKSQLLPKGIKTLAVEAGSPLGWYKYADEVMGMESFGASGKGDDLFNHFGFTVNHIVEMF